MSMWCRNLIRGLLLLSFAGAHAHAGAQCCSTGTPAGASEYVGVLNKQTLRVIAAFRHSYSDTYFTEDHRATGNTVLKDASFNHAGVTVGYGITRRLTAEFDMGYFFNKTQRFSNIDYIEKGYGLSNAGITLKYGAYVRKSIQLEITPAIGIRFPFNDKPQTRDYVQLSRDVQPSTNALGTMGMLFFQKGFPKHKLRLFSINRFEYNFPGYANYKYGNILQNSVFISKSVTRNLYATLQVRNEYKTHDYNDGVKVANSGYDLLTLTPQFTYAFGGKWNFSVLFDLPAYKYYNGRQLTPSNSIAFSITRDFPMF